MSGRGRWRWLALGLLTVGPGCLGHLHPVSECDPNVAACCRELPPCCRSRVYVFFVQGVDPLGIGNLTGVHDYVRQLGFTKTYYGQVYHAGHFEKEIRRLHHEGPETRFVLVGFSAGANKVRTIAQNVKDDGVRIDLLVYLGGNTLRNVPHDRPDNAVKVVHVLAKGFDRIGTSFDDAENVHVPDAHHFGSPSHPYTLQMLARELAMLAATVPVTEPSAPPGDEIAPAPNPLAPAAERLPAEWDFLKPATRLGPVRPDSEEIPATVPPGASVVQAAEGEKAMMKKN